MEKQTEESVAGLVKFITESLREGKDFVLDQAPGVAQEIVRWEIASAVLGILLGFGLLGASICFFKGIIYFTPSRSEA